MIDAAAIKTQVESLLAGLIGTYTFSGGQTTSAIRIEDGSDPYTEEPSVDGLEVVIKPETAIEGEIMLGGDRRLDFTSQVILKQFNILETTQAARNILLRNLDFASVVVVPRSIILDSVEVCTIELQVESFHVLRL